MHRDNASALHLSGVALFQAGAHGDALARIRKSLAIDPDSAEAWSNLGLVLHATGADESAIEAFERATRLEPESVELLANLAAAQFTSGRHAQAEASARRLLVRDAKSAKGWYIVALALYAQNRILEALDAATRASAIAPDQEAHAGLKAQIESAIGAHERARRTLEAAIARHPVSAPLRFALANLLEERLTDLPIAAFTYDQVLRIDPNHGPALSQLTFLRGRLADWGDHDQLAAQYRSGVARGLPALSPFAFLSLPSTRAEQRQCARTWAATFTAGVAAPRHHHLSAGRLRIGYLSADFHSHATAFLATGLFEQHDRTRFEVIGYSTGPDDHSSIRARLERAFDRFVDLRGQRPFAIAEAIRRDRIDILVDLKGHTQGATPLVLALRPAAIQVHYLGYPGTLEGGLVDYLIADTIVIPPDHLADYSETIAALPDSYQINDRNRPVGRVPSRNELGLPTAGVVFCSFNQTYKTNPRVFDAWMSILRAVPESVLWLLARTDRDPAIGNLCRAAQDSGIDPSRLVFAQPRPNPDYLALYRQADLFLDTWPYNAHTTASDALWAGCPVLTIIGTTFAGRVAASLLHAVGLPELVMQSVDRYVEQAVLLTSNRGELNRIKSHLRGPGHESPLFDTMRTTRALEAAYLTMAEQHRLGVRSHFRIDTAHTKTFGSP